MDIKQEELAKKFYLESDIEGIHFSETNEVRLNYLDLLKLMNGFAEQQVKNNIILDDVSCSCEYCVNSVTANMYSCSNCSESGMIND
jgi:hypothetical protein